MSIPDDRLCSSAPDDFKVNPGAVEDISQQPESTDKVTPMTSCLCHFCSTILHRCIQSNCNVFLPFFAGVYSVIVIFFLPLLTFLCVAGCVAVCIS